MRWTAERGGSCEDAVVEVEQAGLDGPNDAKLYLKGDCTSACSKQSDVLQGVVEHQSGTQLTCAATSLPPSTKTAKSSTGDASARNAAGGRARQAEPVSLQGRGLDKCVEGDE